MISVSHELVAILHVVIYDIVALFVCQAHPLRARRALTRSILAPKPQ